MNQQSANTTREWEAKALRDRGIKRVTFEALAPDIPCKANKVHGELCATCDRLPLRGPMHANPAAYFDADRDSQCRNLLSVGSHDQSITLIQGIAQSCNVGGGSVRYPADRGSEE